MLAWLSVIGWAIFDYLFYFFMRHPRLLRFALGLFRRWQPIFAGPFSFLGGATYLVTRADDVREVLTRANDFLLGPVNETKILSGDFVISLDPERRYGEEKEVIRRALPPNRLWQLEDIVARAAAQLLAPPLDNPFEVVTFSERVTVRIVEEFWGLSAAGAQSAVIDAPPGCETMRLWLRKLAIVLGSKHPGPFGIREVGLQCSEEFMSFVRAACATHPPGSVDMIGHILWHSGDDMDVTVRNIAGLVMTGSAVVTKAFSHAFEQLFHHPRALAAARILARRAVDQGRTPEHRDRARQQVGQLLIEALRFNPVFPVLPRHCVRPATLAAGTPRATQIPAGAHVIAAVTGAMFDPEAVDHPDHFGLGRSLRFNDRFATDDWRYGSRHETGAGIYFVFGGGEHWCLGDQMAVAEMAAMAIALLNRLRQPRLARGLRYDGSAAASLLIGHRA